MDGVTGFETAAVIPVGMGPEGIALDTVSRRGFVARSSSNSLVAFDLDTRQVLGEVAVGAEPIAAVADTVTGRVFTADAKSDTVSVIDAAALRRVASIRVGAYPAGLGLAGYARKPYVGNTAGATVSVLEADTLAVLHTVPARLGAGSIGVDPVGNRVYVVNFGAACLTVLDAASANLSPCGVAHGPPAYASVSTSVLRPRRARKRTSFPRAGSPCWASLQPLLGTAISTDHHPRLLRTRSSAMS